MRRYLKRKAVANKRQKSEDYLFRLMGERIQTPQELENVLSGVDEMQKLLVLRKLAPHLPFEVQFFIDHNEGEGKPVFA